MNKTIDLNIWNREFTLEIKFDCYSGEEVTKEQENAIKDFTSQQEWLNNAKSIVEDFCKEKVTEDKKNNIFSYIKPDYLFVTRDKAPKVALMCNYKYDPEHGLAIVFTNDGNITVDNQDIIL